MCRYIHFWSHKATYKIRQIKRTVNLFCKNKQLVYCLWKIVSYVEKAANR